MEKLRALIVDDEPHARALLQKLLEETTQFTEIREAASAGEAMQALSISSPNLVFLDIQLPGMNGIDFYRQLRSLNISCEAIFVTAYDAYMLDAIRGHAFGYLLKPVNRGDLASCIIDYRAKHFGQNHEKQPRLKFKTRGGYFFIDPAEVLMFKADGNYTQIFAREKQIICSVAIGEIQNMLSDDAFVRLGRSHIVNASCITSVNTKKGVIELERGRHHLSLKVSRDQLKGLSKRIA